MISNERIIDAYLCVLDKHTQVDCNRSLRLLNGSDFVQIRKIKRAFDKLRATQELVYGPKEPYYEFRSRYMNQWQATHRWKPETRNLYASILSKLSNWNRHGGKLSSKDRDRLNHIRPGAMLLLELHLPEQTKLLLRAR